MGVSKKTKKNRNSGHNAKQNLFNLKFKKTKSTQGALNKLKIKNYVSFLLKNKIKKKFPNIAKFFLGVFRILSKKSSCLKVYNFKRYSLKLRLDLYLKLLFPKINFFLLKKNSYFFNIFFFVFLLWPGEYLDILALVIYSNPLFFNTQLFDLSAFLNYKKKNFNLILYYIFKIPLFSTWLVTFINYSILLNFKKKILTVISIENLFKSMGWAEREVSELFGIFFFSKKNNRKLITDYFFKIYPLLKWVPSIGFSEIFVSSEGFFLNRGVKLFNSTLS